MRSSRGLRITSILVALPVALFFVSLFVIVCIGTLGQVKKWLNPIVPIFTVLESVLIPVTYVFGIASCIVAAAWLAKVIFNDICQLSLLTGANFLLTLFSFFGEICNDRQILLL